MKKLLFLFMMMLLPCTQLSANDVIQKESTKRCEATTKKGTRCKAKALEKSKYCRAHQANSSKVVQCKAKTKEGTRCTRAAKSSGYCTQHYKMKKEGKLKE